MTTDRRGAAAPGADRVVGGGGSGGWSRLGGVTVRHHGTVPDRSDEVRAANAAFYEAFEGLDLDAMVELWEHSDRAAVMHPGWPPVQGWARVRASWELIFRNTPFIQFLCTDEAVSVEGTTAWVTLEENILQEAGSRDGGEDVSELSGARVATVNVFVHDGSRWRLVVHHGALVGADERPAEP